MPATRSWAQLYQFLVPQPHFGVNCLCLCTPYCKIAHSAYSILQKLEQPIEFRGAELQLLISVGAEENHIQQVSNMMVAWGSKAVMCISNLFHRSPHWISMGRPRTGPGLQDLMSELHKHGTHSMPAIWSSGLLVSV